MGLNQLLTKKTKTENKTILKLKDWYWLNNYMMLLAEEHYKTQRRELNNKSIPITHEDLKLLVSYCEECMNNNEPSVYQSITNIKDYFNINIINNQDLVNILSEMDVFIKHFKTLDNCEYFYKAKW